MKGTTVLVAAALLLVLGCVAGFSQAWEHALPPLAEPAHPSASPEVLRRGAELAAVGDCMVCHTARDGQPFAGGLPIHTPFGTIYSTNITPDPDTGIGRWSLEAFSRAMRDGVSRDGHLLYPAFPYPHFTQLSDDDIVAVYAFMMSRDPVRTTAPVDHLIFPLNFRPLVAGWNLFFLHRGESSPDAAQSPEWNRGRYLVNGLGHCAACHSPMNALGAEKAGEPFAGGRVDGWNAPALTRLLDAPTPWTHAQLVAYLRTGLASEHGAAAGPMEPVAHQLADVPQADVEAMATYLMSLQTAPAATPASARVEAGVAPGANGEGATLFAAACASCHGAGSPMQTQVDRPSLSRGTAVHADSPRNAVRMVLDGIGWKGSERARFMPAFATMLTDAQIAEIVNYTRVEYGERAPWPGLDAAAVEKIRKEASAP